MTSSGLLRPVYLDYQATTPCDPAVLEAMLPYFCERFGNPHSHNHFYGWEAEEAVEQARQQIAAVIGAEAREIVFTSGATEANNLALKGIAGRYGDQKNHLVTVATEHPCVLETCRQLEKQGLRVTYLPVQDNGLIDLPTFEATLTENTALVSVMAVNNEIGVIQQLAEIGTLCRSRGVLFHTDAAQAVGKIPLDVDAMNIDLMSISAHKLYGPKGVGALFVRRRPRVRLTPLITGGGQERGARSGTLPTPLCVGMGLACSIAQRELPAEAERLRGLRRRLLAGIKEQLPDVRLNGDPERRIPGNLSLSFPGVEGDRLLRELPLVALSTGSACSSGSLEPSHVLQALGVDAELALATLRIGLGRHTTENDVAFAVNQVVEAVRRLRDSPPAQTGNRLFAGPQSIP